MGFFDIFKTNKAAGVSIEQETFQVRPPELIIQGPPVLLKPLKWVAWQGKHVGIVTKLDVLGNATVDWVNDIGETISTDIVNAGELQLAQYKQIPANRRPVDVAYAATLGYV